MRLFRSCRWAYFFLISGYYFFYGHQFCKEEYFRKIIKRSRTLLLPYLIWNLLPMMNIVAGNLFSIIFRGKSTEALQTYFADLLNNGIWHIWWDITGGTMPYDSPLWYVRDLMIMCILSPIAYLYIKRLKSWGMGILAILYLAGVNTGVVGLSMSAIVFFILGGAFLNQCCYNRKSMWFCIEMEMGSCANGGFKLGALFIISWSVIRSYMSNVLYPFWGVCQLLSDELDARKDVEDNECHGIIRVLYLCTS